MAALPEQQRKDDALPSDEDGAFDVIVVGAGFGGVYATYRFREQGLSVCTLESAGRVGGVWNHNRYPGARVDVESLDYCYFFSPELFNEWRWTERYSPQAEIQRYIEHVVERFDLSRHILLNTPMTGARWVEDRKRWFVETGSGKRMSARFLVMAVGNLSKARKPPFEGLEDFEGEWVMTSHWPDRQVDTKGRRIGVIGTGSSGIQAIPVLAEQAEHLFVFQRTPNYSAPAHNGPLDETAFAGARNNVERRRAELLNMPGATSLPMPEHPASHYSEEERQKLLEQRWALGGHAMNTVFSDQATKADSNRIVSDFMRDKIRQIVNDPVVAEKLCPHDHPIGTRRLCVDTGYYQSFNRSNISLIDIREDPIERIVPKGILTAGGRHYDLDLIVFALGFDAFMGSIDAAHIRNGEGRSPTDNWTLGPRTMLGLMTRGFPNLFLPTGAGSPSVLANLVLHNEQQMDWIGDCIAYLDAHGFRTIEPTEEAQEGWAQHCAEVASKLLRLQVKNYMTKVNPDGSRIFMPYAGGMPSYIEHCTAAAAQNYADFDLN